MRFLRLLSAGLMLAAAGCTTTSGTRNAVEARWNGQSAGAFFAEFGAPSSDTPAGGTTLYSWRGGHKTRTIAATYETLPNGKRGKRLTPARVEYMNCAVQLSVSPDYTIRSVRIVVDKPGQNGKTYCEELLG
ncbi:hypothetical protein [Rhizobium halophytocola]|uniref:Lipoprotein n=1 Tax=Rhizobium halophytocola TaxID=735519 RepID=A0ABS4DX45_9HYPH|nr:hypothetical protein [Rhizobium halophytocola]MBP1850260.1 hypothetical protein [Rhizobium halophytocola]